MDQSSGLGVLTGADLDDPVSDIDAQGESNRAIIYVICLATVAVYFLIWPIWRAQFLVEIWPTEGWNAYFQDAAAAGLRLYPDPAGFVGNNYPPLSFYAIGLIGKLTDVDNLFVGRCVLILVLPF